MSQMYFERFSVGSILDFPPGVKYCFQLEVLLYFLDSGIVFIRSCKMHFSDMSQMYFKRFAVGSILDFPPGVKYCYQLEVRPK